MNPKIRFYSYTKSLPYWIARFDKIPENLVLTASRGGSRDSLIDEYNLIEARVVYHPNDAKTLGYKIDHNDWFAFNKKNRKSYALLLHSTMPKNSLAAKAIIRMKKEGIKFSYNKKD